MDPNSTTSPLFWHINGVRAFKLVSLARLSHGVERESGLLPYIDLCLTPQGFVGSLIGSDNVCGRDVVQPVLELNYLTHTSQFVLELNYLTHTSQRK